MDQTIRDLQAEGESLDELVARLTDEQWHTATPAAGWTIAHQIGHLLWSDEAALAALQDQTAFSDLLESALSDPLGLTDRGAEQYAALPPGELLARWRETRDRLAGALAEAPRGDKVPWFGPPMSPRSMATARLMETWAHGLDIADSLGFSRPPTGRLRDIAHLGVRTRDFAYAINGMEAPTQEFRIELKAPDDATWTWGPEDADERVTGTAAAFCFVVAQRRDPDEVGLIATGEQARQWLTIAQVFAGPPRASVRAAHDQGRAR